MSDLSAKVAKARKAGYSDDEITAFLGKDPSLSPKITQARQAGYKPSEIVNHLETAPRSSAIRDAQKRVASTPDQVRAFTKGVSFGFADEIDAASAFAEAGVRNALTRATGGKPRYSAQDAYGAVMDANKADDAQFAKKHPGQNALLQIAGGFASPGAGAAARYVGKATSLGGAALRTARVGAVTGAITGAGNADSGKRVKSAIEGAGIGAAIGGAAPYVARGAQEVVKRVGAAGSEAASRVRLGLGGETAQPSPRQIAEAGDKATEYVSDIARRAKPDALTANAAEAAGKPITAAEALGRPAMTQLTAVSRREGATGDALESALRQRQQAMPERVLKDLQDATGLAPEAIYGDHKAHAAALRTKAAPLYDAAYADKAVDDPKIDALFRRPSMKRAMARASSIAKEEGRDPTALGFEVQAGPGRARTVYETKTETVRGALGEPIEVRRQVPVKEEVVGGPIAVRRPTNQTHDYIKRGLDDVLETYRDKTTGKLRLDERGRAILSTLNEYRALVAPEGSNFRKALDAGGDPIRLEQAFNNAKRQMSNGVPSRVFMDKFKAMGEAERQAQVAGWVSDAFEGAQSGRLKLRDMQSPLYANKVKAMIGPEKAKALLDKLALEIEIARRGSRMMPGAGSPTMELQAADKEVAEGLKTVRGVMGKLSSGKPISAAMEAISSPIVGAYRGAQAPIDQATRDEVGRLLQLSPSELEAVLKAAKVKPKVLNTTKTAVGTNALVRSAASANAKQ